MFFTKNMEIITDSRMRGLGFVGKAVLSVTKFPKPPCIFRPNVL